MSDDVDDFSDIILNNEGASIEDLEYSLKKLLDYKLNMQSQLSLNNITLVVPLAVFMWQAYESLRDQGGMVSIIAGFTILVLWALYIKNSDKAFKEKRECKIINQYLEAIREIRTQDNSPA